MQTNAQVPPQEQPEEPEELTFDVTEVDIDEVIATCSGDPRAAIRALLWRSSS